ncbi:MAG: S8 family serine peptidase, partial [Thermoflexales bacterium]|nr:S8 family serine peptidase [Thermoflexales bacterium]
MRQLLVGSLALALISAPALNPSQAQTVLTKLTPALAEALAALPADAQVRVIVRFQQAEHQRIVTTQLDKPLQAQRAERGALVAALRQAAETSQRGVRAFLSRPEVATRVQDVRELWSVNALALSAPPDVVRALASRSDVVEVMLDEWKRWLADESMPPSVPLPLVEAAVATRTPISTALEARLSASPPAPGETTWGIAKIGADRVWRELGVTGANVVVANIDTGVDWHHPALKNRYRGWNGGPVADHLHNWFDATNEASVYPSDLNGHGTHTMGTIVGEGGIGVAPGARWMAAKGLNGQGFGFYSWLLACMQFMLAPNGNPALAPHVLSNSWGSEDGNDTTLQSAVRALRAAGI